MSMTNDILECYDGFYRGLCERLGPQNDETQRSIVVAAAILTASFQTYQSVEVAGESISQKLANILAEYEERR